MTRRDALFALFGVTLLKGAWTNSYGFWVEYTCDVRAFGGVENFTEVQKKYENTEGIVAFNRELWRTGGIIDFKFETFDNGNIAKWTYGFRDQKTFEKWERDLHELGLVVNHSAYTVHKSVGSRPELVARRFLNTILAKA